MTSRHLPLYWINLEGSIDRRESLLQELQRAGVRDHTRVPAISPSDLSSFEIISAPGTPALLPTEWACTLSHLTAVRTWRSNELEGTQGTQQKDNILKIYKPQIVHCV